MDVTVDLISPCAELTIKLRHYNDALETKSITLDGIYLHEKKLECECKQLANLSSLIESHFECSRFNLECIESLLMNESEQSQVSVHIDELKLEIDGEPAILKQGQFSKRNKFVC